MGLKKRSKSGLLPPDEVAKEPETGPGSATCFCRVQDRRMKAEEARLALCNDISSQDGPKFWAEIASYRTATGDLCYHDADIVDRAALDELYEAMKATMKNGRRYRIRIAVVA